MAPGTGMRELGNPGLAAWRKNGQNFLQALPYLSQIRGSVGREGQGHLGLISLSLVTQVLTGAGDGVSLFVEKTLDAHDALDITFAVHALTRAAFYGLELGELRLPETEDVGGQAAEARHLPDPEIQLLRNKDVAGLAGLSVALLFRTHATCEKWRPARRKAYRNSCLRRF